MPKGRVFGPIDPVSGVLGGIGLASDLFGFGAGAKQRRAASRFYNYMTERARQADAQIRGLYPSLYRQAGFNYAPGAQGQPGIATPIDPRNFAQDINYQAYAGPQNRAIEQARRAGMANLAENTFGGTFQKGVSEQLLNERLGQATANSTDAWIGQERDRQAAALSQLLGVIQGQGQGGLEAAGALGAQGQGDMDRFSQMLAGLGAMLAPGRQPTQTQTPVTPTYPTVPTGPGGTTEGAPDLTLQGQMGVGRASGNVDTEALSAAGVPAYSGITSNYQAGQSAMGAANLAGGAMGFPGVPLPAPQPMPPAVQGPLGTDYYQGVGSAPPPGVGGFVGVPPRAQSSAIGGAVAPSAPAYGGGLSPEEEMAGAQDPMAMANRIIHEQFAAYARRIGSTIGVP